jgi:hypothetical protein
MFKGSSKLCSQIIIGGSYWKTLSAFILFDVNSLKFFALVFGSVLYSGKRSASNVSWTVICHVNCTVMGFFDQPWKHVQRAFPHSIRRCKLRQSHVINRELITNVITVFALHAEVICFKIHEENTLINSKHRRWKLLLELCYSFSRAEANNLVCCYSIPCRKGISRN